jgi:hypothetical protein
MIHWFFEWGWLYLMIIMSVILTVQLICHWKEWDAPRKLGAFTVIVLTFHVWEEWVIPGGFHYYYNISSEAALRDRYPMSRDHGYDYEFRRCCPVVHSVECLNTGGRCVLP